MTNKSKLLKKKKINKLKNYKISLKLRLKFYKMLLKKFKINKYRKNRFLQFKNKINQ